MCLQPNTLIYSIYCDLVRQWKQYQVIVELHIFYKRRKGNSQIAA
jgi:hypothetical protein